jgi:hypothetical protein
MRARRAFLAGIGLLGLLVGSAATVYTYVHSGSAVLHVSLSVEKVEYGIPGITKVYDAFLENTGSGPVRVTRCDFLSDGGDWEQVLAYAVQRWSNSSQRWEEIAGTSREKFCHPYPLGMSRTHLKRMWFWPGQVLSIGEEATAARDGIKIGDKLRFVVFTGEPGDYSSSIPTEAFIIDEASTSDVPERIRH